MKMNLLTMPSEHFEARKTILGESLASRMTDCVEYINKRYEQRNKLTVAVDFCFYDLMESPSSDVESISGVGFFPWVEASKELDQSLSLILMGHYKHAYDSFRRAIELVITGAFFVSKSADHTNARGWMMSDRSTPNFKRACNSLAKASYFDEINNRCGWVDDILALYWSLSDVVHVKGVSNSYNELSPVYSYINGVGIPTFSEKGCKPALDSYLLTVRHIAIVIAASNPYVLQGLDLDIKFGLNPPASGFFYPKQTERLMSLLPEAYVTYFENVRDTDENLKGVREWFDSLPDITDEEIHRQAQYMGFDQDKNT